MIHEASQGSTQVSQGYVASNAGHISRPLCEYHSEISIAQPHHLSLLSASFSSASGSLQIICK